MKSEHSLEYVAEHHVPILTAAALEGVDTDAVVQGATRLIGYGDTRYGYGAACILDIVQTPYVMEPHVIWFPWTTPRNRMVHFKWAMEKMAETHQVLLNIEKKHTPFFEHFVKNGFLRKIGFINNLPIVEEIHMYQVQRRSS